MPNLAGQALPYIKGLGNKVAQFGSRFHSAAQGVGLYGSMFANRTALGAAAGGAYGAMSDNTSVIGGALAGAGLARYGGSFAAGAMNAKTFRGGMMSMAGMGGAMRAGARAAALRGRIDGMRAGGFINNTITRGYNRIRGLGR